MADKKGAESDKKANYKDFFLSEDEEEELEEELYDDWF
jgi:hypothetical protein